VIKCNCVAPSALVLGAQTESGQPVPRCIALFHGFVMAVRARVPRTCRESRRFRHFVFPPCKSPSSIPSVDRSENSSISIDFWPTKLVSKNSSRRLRDMKDELRRHVTLQHGRPPRPLQPIGKIPKNSRNDDGFDSAQSRGVTCRFSLCLPAKPCQRLHEKHGAPVAS
jgi:hypothetical protein